MTGKTCTVRYATTGVCGKPAVHRFVTKYAEGEEFYECAEHYTGPPMREKAPAFTVGERVTVTHVGVTKVGTVETVGRTRVGVRVATYGGKHTKVVTVPMTEVEKAATF